jgi:hypothetical protein
MAISALRPPPLFYESGRLNSIEVPVNMQQDEILKLAGEEFVYIPRQQVFANKVELFTDNEIKKPGNYDVLKNEQVLSTISFNINRTESKPEYNEIPDLEKIKVIEDVKGFLSSAGFLKEAGGLWKWFITFALFLLILETLLLKYFK